MANLYSYMQSEAHAGDLAMQYWPGSDERSMRPQEESPITQMFASGFVHRVTNPREMAKLMVKEAPYSGRTKPKESP